MRERERIGESRCACQRMRMLRKERRSKELLTRNEGGTTLYLRTDNEGKKIQKIK